MNKTDLLALQAGFVFRLETMAMFLGTAMDLIAAAKHKLTEAEKTGFNFCVETLRANARGVIETGEMLQEIEAKNG